ncbi:OsmC family protein [Neisseria bacilliformis]|jgi:putative osmC-like stress-induced protein|uniref:Ribosome biogenesis GTP-binding protein YsxC n=1 Tax=Neisseria bacilliformis ATCC BAA-1200 TaxID=888742 RepID=F2BG50_9NEIS|nr:OsmC family protein [Neisseria bacilliformis]EGF07171.1 ribosome biogenesis GTP-binding protein YsxC [Neisseria bacilliformis ATCC BAA-1200]QMT47229.1 OsmC family protein [Neisseria bacilliformis]
MRITSKRLDNLCFVGTTEAGHSVVMEGSAVEDGVKRGPSPMEMLLLGVAGCSSIDVVMIAQKQRQDVTDCQATVTAERADEAPRVFTEIHIHFKVFGRNLKEAAIAKAVELSAEKYCSASIMLGKAAKISHSFELAEAQT